MKKSHLLLFAFASFFLLSCGGSKPEEAKTVAEPSDSNLDYDQMAQGFCNCLRPMFEFQEKVMKLATEGNQEAVEAMKEEAMKVQSDGEECVLTIEEKFGIIEGTEKETKAAEALKKACPDIMELMGDLVNPVEEEE